MLWLRWLSPWHRGYDRGYDAALDAVKSGLVVSADLAAQYGHETIESASIAIAMALRSRDG